MNLLVKTKPFSSAFLKRTTNGQTLKCLSSSSTTNAAADTDAKPPNGGESRNANNVEANASEKQFQELLTKKDAELLEMKDKFLRAMADAENTRTRMKKQVDDAKIFGIQKFCKDLLEVADTLNLAIVNTDPNKKEAENKNTSSANVKEQLLSMHNGLVMTEKCLLKVFERNGLNQLSPGVGDAFDPNLHEAVFKMPASDQVKTGTVGVVIKTGYKLNERVIRAAQVGVVQ